MAQQQQEPADETGLIRLHQGTHLGLPWPAYVPPPSPPDEGGGGFDLAHLGALLREGWRWIALSGFLVFAAVMAWTMTGRMKFEASSKLYLGDLASSNGDEVYGPDGQSDIVSEVEILRSRSMIERAILASGLNVRVAAAGEEPLRYWEWLASGRNPAVVDSAARALRVRDARLITPRAEALPLTVTVLDGQRVKLAAKGEGEVEGKLGEPLRLGAAVSLTLLPGGEGPPAPGAAFDLEVDPLPEVYVATQRALSVTAPKAPAGGAPVKIVDLAFAHPSPYHTAAFLDELMSLYLQARQEWKTENAKAAEEFVSRQLEDMRASLRSTQEKMAELRSSNEDIVIEGQSESIVRQIADYESQLVASRLQVEALARIKRTLQQPDAPVEAYMFGEANDTVLENLGRSLAESVQTLTDLQSRYQDDTRTVREQLDQVAAQRRSILNYVSGRLDRARKDLGSLEQVLAGYKERLRSVPGAELGLSQITRESDVYGKMYALLLEQQQQAALTKASTVSKNRVLDAPRVAALEASPALPLRVVVSLLGFVLGALFVVLRGLLSDKLRSEHTARLALGHTPVFACIPRGARQSKLRRLAPHELAASHRDRGYSEAFRTLRTHLYRALPEERGGAVVLVTSPSPRDGKTTCVFSLAAMLAADDRRVLVIDADLRKPSHHDITGLPREPGLQGLIAGPGVPTCDTGGRLVTWQHVVYTAQHAWGEFDCINAGDGSRPDLLTRRSVALLLERARARYDFILVDSPSCPLVSDALILAPLCDLVLTVVRVGHSTRRQVSRHVESLLPLAHAHTAVINDAERAKDYGYYAFPTRARPVAMGAAGPGGPAST